MSTADEDRWAEPDANDWSEASTSDFAVPPLDAATRNEAIAAVNEALANYTPPGLASRVWDALWLWQYMLKLRFAVRLVRFLCRPGTGRDSRLVSQKVWRKLNL